MVRLLFWRNARAPVDRCHKQGPVAKESGPPRLGGNKAAGPTQIPGSGGSWRKLVGSVPCPAEARASDR
jgi:hypothetical protein